ncbi:MAG: hypothetical protein HQL67_10315 [Magnetococcales bacterium]|nr:hypothetical protein [Magnetococcales bacterium]
MNNYFAAEALILTQLEQLNDSFRQIGAGRSLEAIREHPGAVPALFLIYDGQKPDLGAGREQAIHQQWLLVVVVRSARQMENGIQERIEAGPLLIRLCETLIGWQPDSEHGPLTLNTAPGPVYHHGYGYYPLRMSTRLILRGLS